MKPQLPSLLTLAAAALLAVACGSPTETSGNDGGAGDGGSPDAGPADTDVALVRLLPNGTVDTAFGQSGTARLDLSTGLARDSVYSIARDGQGRVIVFGSAKGEGARTDADRVVVRVGANGSIDTTFGSNGVARLNIEDLPDNQRNGIVQADGKIVSSGYVTKATGVGTQTAPHVALQRLNADGTADTTFGTNGLVISNPFQSGSGEWGSAEAYGVGVQSTGKYVAIGYGREAPTGPVDVVSFRYDATGNLDNSYGTAGKAVFDFVSDNDRGRNIAVLPDNRLFVVGSATTSTGNGDALVMLLSADGSVDTSFSTDGKDTRDHGRTDDAFYGAAASATHLVAVGYSAGAAAGGQTPDEDSTIFIYPLNGGATISQVVPLSADGDDRLFSATFDGAGKIVASGFIDVGGDTRMAVARFNLDGTLDTTFGQGGIATVNVQAGGKVEAARGVVVLGDGKIVVGSNVER